MQVFRPVPALAGWPLKGQLISRCPFGVIFWTKKTNEKFDKFLPLNLKRDESNKIKAISYNTIIYI